MASHIDHAAIGARAAAQEFRLNPEKTWPCVARNVCAACGETMEPGQAVKRHLGPGSVRHADCAVSA